MATIRISKIAIEQAMQAAALTRSPVRLYDDSLRGFCFIAAVSGGGSYFIEYRLPSKGISTQRYRLGAHGPLTPASARELAQRLLGQAAQGIDLQAQKQGERGRASGMRFGELVESYLNFRDTGSRYWKETRRVFKNEIPAKLSQRPAELLTRADLRQMLDRTREHAPATERWLLTALGPLFAWASERGYLTASPAAGLSRPAVPASRDRVLSPDELQAFLKAADSMSYPWRPFFLLLALTGARRNEVAGMRWEELSLEGAGWTIPAARTKNKRLHALELPDMAVRTLQGVGVAQTGFVLTVTGRSPVSGYDKAKRALDARMAALGAPAPWRIHDLRRTFATHAAEYLGIDEGVIERLLNHATATGGLKGVYQRQEYRAKRRDAMTAWGRYIEGLLGNGAER